MWTVMEECIVTITFIENEHSTLMFKLVCHPWMHLKIEMAYNPSFLPGLYDCTK